MHEAFTLNGEFAKAKGWTTDEVLMLVSSLNSFVDNWPKKLFQGFLLTVHLEPYRYWRNLDDTMPSASRECARRIFAAAYGHYAKSDTLVISSIEAFYDRSESFLRHIHRDWTDKKVRRQWPFFRCLKMVAPVIAEDTPAVQATDMIAWCANRVKAESDPEIVGLCATVLNNRHVQILPAIDAWYLQSNLSKLVIPDSPRIV